MIFVLLNGEVDRGSDLIERVLVNNPNFANAWNARGFISLIRGDGARALESFDHSTRLNPVDDWSAVNAMQGKMSALWVLDRYSDALEFADRLLARRPNDIRGLFMVFSTDPDPTRAAKAGDRIRTLYPHLRSSDLRQLFFFQSPRHRAMVE